MPDCKDMTDINQNPPCNEKELACHEAKAPDDSRGRITKPLRMRSACKELLLVPYDGLDTSVYWVRWLHLQTRFQGSEFIADSHRIHNPLDGVGREESPAIRFNDRVLVPPAWNSIEAQQLPAQCKLQVGPRTASLKNDLEEKPKVGSWRPPCAG
jgi:hypothetical protein